MGGHERAQEDPAQDSVLAMIALLYIYIWHGTSSKSIVRRKAGFADLETEILIG